VKPSQCLKILELGKSASVDQIKQSYRRLAHQCHPDINKNNHIAQEQFIKISNAYRTLMQTTRAVQSGKKVGVCSRCRKFGEVIKGTDGSSHCIQCALSPSGGRLLPLPVIVVAKCAGTIILIAAAVYLLVMALSTGKSSYALAAFFTGIAALAFLAYTCLSVVYCISTIEQIRQKRNNHRK